MRDRVLAHCERGPNLMDPDYFCASYLFWIGQLFFYFGVAVLFCLHASVDGVAILSIQGPWWTAQLLPATPAVAGFVMSLAAFGIQTICDTRGCDESASIDIGSSIRSSDKRTVRRRGKR